jgi:exopolysaccharide production protein ExoQ
MRSFREHSTSTVEDGVAEHRAIVVASALFLMGVCGLELHNFASGFQPWNLSMVGAAAIASVMAGLYLFTGRNKPQPRLFAIDAIYVTYLVWCCASALWSVAPVNTLVQVAYAFIAWIATLLLRVTPIGALVRAVLKIGFVLALVSFLFVFIEPRLAFQPSFSIFPELRGVFQHQQRLGLFMGLCLGLILVATMNREFKRTLRGGSMWRFILVTTIALAFVLAFARLNVVFIALAALATWAIFKSPRMRVISVAGIVAFSTWLTLNASDLIAGFAEDGGDITLTGRTNVWTQTLLAAQDAGLFGYGFASFTDPSFDAFWNSYRAPSAHNSVLQSYFETGWIGVALIVCVFLSQLFTSFRSGVTLNRVPYAFFLVLISALSSITGVTYAGKPTIAMLITLLFVAAERQAASRMGEVTERQRTGSSLSEVSS